MATDNQLQSLQPPGEHSEKHVSVGEYIKSAVYGGLDGIITTFSIALSGFGSATSVSAIVSFGVSSLIADGLSMAIADYLATKSDEQYMMAEKAREEKEIEDDLPAEKREMAKIYEELGVETKDAKQIVEILSSNKEGFLDVMMIEELGLSSDEENPITNSVVTFFAFAIFGLMPLLPFIVIRASSGNVAVDTKLVWISGILTAFFLFVLGFSKSMIVLSKWYLSGLEAIVIGGLSAGVAFGVGVAFGENKV